MRRARRSIAGDERGGILVLGLFVAALLVGCGDDAATAADVKTMHSPSAER